MRDLVPWPGIKPGPPALGVRSLNHWTTGEVPTLTFIIVRSMNQAFQLFKQKYYTSLNLSCFHFFFVLCIWSLFLFFYLLLEYSWFTMLRFHFKMEISLSIGVNSYCSWTIICTITFSSVLSLHICRETKRWKLSNLDSNAQCHKHWAPDSQKLPCCPFPGLHLHLPSECGKHTLTFLQVDLPKTAHTLKPIQLFQGARPRFMASALFQNSRCCV